MKRKIVTAILSTILVLTACAQETTNAESNTEMTAEESPVQKEADVTQVTLSPLASENTVAGSAAFDEIDAGTLFTDRDQKQEADLSDAEYITVTDGADISITKEGVYVLSGQASDVTIVVDADSKDKVQLVLNGLQITNQEQPCIYVKSVDKVFVTTNGENSLSVNGTFTADGDTNTDAVIFSKDDLVLNGTGTLSITSSDNGITSKDGIKVTGGTWNISCEGSALEAHEEILVADGTITIDRCNDGLHAENDDDDTTGYVYIGGGTITITAADDAIHATTLVKIDAGELNLNASEAIEGTAVQINGGNLVIAASDDGINAAHKSSAYSSLFELNGGTVTIDMADGDTDGVDSNGDIIINGGYISINGKMSTFDYDGTATYNGGTIVENGEETNTITNQFANGFPGGGPGGFGGSGGQDRPDGAELPDGFEPPEGFEMPEGFEPPEGFEIPEGMERPEGFQMPEGMEPPEGFDPNREFDGQNRPQRPENGNGQGRQDRDNRENGQ